jgi:glycosyltransferase involved in cell wall biosynthesis
MSKTAFVAYFFYNEDGVASLRSRVLSEVLEERGNELDIITKKTFGKKAQKNKLLWGMRVFTYLMRADYDSLYISCGPFWHLRFVILACLLRKKKFIVDFRDPWSVNLRSGYGGSKPIAKDSVVKRAEFWEKIIYKHCERMWTVTEGMKDSYKPLLGDGDKITVVINGHNIEIDELPKEQLSSEHNATKYVCMGKFAEYGMNKAEHALKTLKDTYENSDQQYILEFIGSNEELIKPMVEKLEMTENVRFIPRLPYKEAIERAANADIGFCILRDETIEHGTKTFDYIGLGLPIFDCFQKDSHFHSFFAPYLTVTEKRQIPMNIREKFYRKNIFKQYVHEIEQMN